MTFKRKKMLRSLVILLFVFSTVFSVTQKYQPILGDFDTWTIDDNVVNYKPKRYDIEYSITNLQEKWALTTYSKIAEDIIKLARDAFPYGKFI